MNMTTTELTTDNLIASAYIQGGGLRIALSDGDAFPSILVNIYSPPASGKSNIELARRVRNALNRLIEKYEPEKEEK